MIYVYDDLDNITYNDYLKICELNKKISKKNLKYDDNVRHELCIFLLRIFLLNNKESKLYDTFYYSDNGQPIIDNYHISFSRCKNGVVFGISKKEIGVDIDDYSNDYSLERNVFLSEEEIKLVKNSKDYVFFVNCKESYLKSNGLGINDEIYNIDFSKYYKKNEFKKNNIMFCYREKENYSYLICYKENIKIKKLTYKDIRRYIYEFEKEKI